MAWGKLGSETLTSSGDLMNTGTIASNKFIQVLGHLQDTGGIIYDFMRFNSVSTSTYARRRSVNGASEGTVVNNTFNEISNNTASDHFHVSYIFNLASEEKLVMNFSCEQKATGASNIPERYESYGKWAETSNAITSIQMVNEGAGSYDTGSNISALGSDAVSSVTVQNGAVFEETDTNKHYLLDSGTWTEL